MNPKKKLKFIFLFLLLLILPMSYIKADSEGVGGGGPASTCANGWCWHDFEGIRISFYHKNGTKIGKSLNFYNSNQSIKGETYDFRYSKYLDTTFYTTALNNSKYDYIISNSSLIHYSQWPKRNFGNIFTGGIDFEKNLYETGYSKNVFDEKLGLSNETEIINKLRKYESYFEFNNTNLSSIVTDSSFYMLVEPITILKNNKGNLYIGTYYELQQIYNSVISSGNKFGSAISLFKSSNSWGDAKFAMSIYLEDNGVFEGTGNFIETINSLKRKTVFNDVNNTYGIGVFWIKPSDFKDECNQYSDNYNILTGTCEPTPPRQEISTCKVLDPVVDPCNDRIVYEYQNCSTSGYSKVTYSESTICDIQCNEKYYVATWPTVNVFNPISGTGILAGSYFQGIGPTVYHKKTCSYVYDENKLNEIINSQVRAGCTRTKTIEYPCGISGSEICYEHSSYIDTTCENDIIAKGRDISNQCTVLKTNYDKMNSVNDASKDYNSQKSITLNTGFKDYKLSPTLIKTEYDLDEVKGGITYGYKNTMDYVLLEDINKYIGMNSVHSIIDIEKESFYDNGRSMLTTPLLTGAGEYRYRIDYKNIFSDSFKETLKTYGSINIDNVLDIANTSQTSCPYKIVERNIKKYCIPTLQNNYCGDPDITFQPPKINMIYRPINLSFPFPGKSGNGRQPGSNWSSEDINRYITNNRNSAYTPESISTSYNPESIYQRNPLYVIKLDSKNIKDIREYNKSHAYDDFTLECTLGKGTECLSTYLRSNDLISGGTCKDATTVDDFYKCADK